MTRLAYFDLANGISGDMALAAVAHAGRRIGAGVEDAVAAAVSSIPLGCTVSFLDDERGGLACLRADVKTDGRRHDARALRDAIEGSDTSETARASAVRALDLLVGAEAEAHGVGTDDVHFHELASADTAADLLGVAVALEVMGIDFVAAAPVPVPNGWISSDHGPLPLPAPVVLHLLTGARLRGVDDDQELVTPSGAALLVANRAVFGPLPDMTLETMGVGGGGRIMQRPNICRVLVGNLTTAPSSERLDTCVLLEANIDDQTPEALGHAVEMLVRSGALDAWVTPIVMKKSRPAFALSVLVHPNDEGRLAREVFVRTTTIGLRRRTVARRVLARETVAVRVRGIEVRVKIARLGAQIVNVAPEFDDCAQAAERTGIALNEIYEEATTAARSSL